ncbi:nitrogenase component 1 [uncultured Methanocorpusculum sp.]|nr:nitrogenase component 1 [uncultured Methanocorpusculum sp.]
MQETISESRMAGCTLTGALSVACFIPGVVTVVHAPKGCAHQTFSMLHAMMNEAETKIVPEILVSGLSDKDVIFGGEDCLRQALDRAAAKDPELIIVVTSCVPETIGDDCLAVCREHACANRTIYIPTSGFLGGSAKDGENAALIGLSKLAEPADPIPGTVAVIGEKNLESEVEENFAEVSRLLDLLGLSVSVRFCRNANVAELQKLGTACCFIVRDGRSAHAGRELGKRFGRPVISEFPRGLSGSIAFLQETGKAAGVSQEKIEEAILKETEHQKKMLAKFSDLAGREVCLGVEPFEGTLAVAKEALERLGMAESPTGIKVRLPFYLPVGVSGTVKMLYLWRRTILHG